MKELKGSQTEKNLLVSFAGESQARNRYTYFASQARKEGYDQISFIFEETANQEKEHAKRFFKFLKGGDLEITATFPAGVVGSTMENLLAAAAGENHEHTDLYPWRPVGCSNGIKRSSGAAGIAATFTRARKRLRHALPAPIRRPISNSWERTGRRPGCACTRAEERDLRKTSYLKLGTGRRYHGRETGDLQV
jgi:rubrerythrin